MQKDLAYYFNELKNYFLSPLGFWSIALICLIIGLFLWVFDSGFNILIDGYASMDNFFFLAPWFFMFFISMISVQTFAEERQAGILILSLILPIKKSRIVITKFLSMMTINLIIILCSFFYVFLINEFSLGDISLDLGVLFSSYFGLTLLVSAFTSIGVWSSSVSKTTFGAVGMSFFLCFIFYFGLEQIGSYSSNSFIVELGLFFHYNKMLSGLLNVSNIFFLTSISLLFIGLTIKKIRL